MQRLYRVNKVRHDRRRSGLIIREGINYTSVPLIRTGREIIRSTLNWTSRCFDGPEPQAAKGALRPYVCRQGSSETNLRRQQSGRHLVTQQFQTLKIYAQRWCNFGDISTACVFPQTGSDSSVHYLLLNGEVTTRALFAVAEAREEAEWCVIFTYFSALFLRSLLVIFSLASRKFFFSVVQNDGKQFFWVAVFPGECALQRLAEVFLRDSFPAGSTVVRLPIVRLQWYNSLRIRKLIVWSWLWSCVADA